MKLDTHCQLKISFWYSKDGIRHIFSFLYNKGFTKIVIYSISYVTYVRIYNKI